jgi:hypothetical protein
MRLRWPRVPRCGSSTTLRAWRVRTPPRRAAQPVSRLCRNWAGVGRALAQHRGHAPEVEEAAEARRQLSCGAWRVLARARARRRRERRPLRRGGREHRPRRRELLLRRAAVWRTRAVLPPAPQGSRISTQTTQQSVASQPHHAIESRWGALDASSCGAHRCARAQPRQAAARCGAGSVRASREDGGGASEAARAGRVSRRAQTQRTRARHAASGGSA